MTTMQENLEERLAIHAGDPDEVFVLEVRLLTDYAHAIERDVEDIIAKFSGTTAAAAYIEHVGHNISDETIKGAVKNLARSKFRQKGVAI